MYDSSQNYTLQVSKAIEEKKNEQKNFIDNFNYTKSESSTLNMLSGSEYSDAVETLERYYYLYETTELTLVDHLHQLAKLNDPNSITSTIKVREDSSQIVGVLNYEANFKSLFSKQNQQIDTRDFSGTATWYQTGVLYKMSILSILLAMRIN